MNVNANASANANGNTNSNINSNANNNFNANANNKGNVHFNRKAIANANTKGNGNCCQTQYTGGYFDKERGRAYSMCTSLQSQTDLVAKVLLGNRDWEENQKGSI